MLPVCPVCNVVHAACGAGFPAEYVFDVPDQIKRRPPMAELGLYEVQHRGITTRIKMTEEDAETYGDQAKRVGDVKPAERQPVTQPPWANTSSAVEGETTPPQAEAEKKKAPARRNKTASASNDKQA